MNDHRVSAPLIIFDLDGTLVDSANEILYCVNKMRLWRGLPGLKKKDIVSSIGQGVSSLICRSFPNNQEDADELISEFRKIYSTVNTPPASVFQGAFDTLKTLVNIGCSVAVVTNKPQELCFNVLNQTGLGRYFTYVFAAGGEFQDKPSPESTRFLMSKCNTSCESTYFVGDTTSDQKTAHSAQVKFLFFRNGYDDGVLLTKADREIDRLSQILTII